MIEGPAIAHRGGHRGRDILSGAICFAFGAGAVMQARSYAIGTLDQLGPGFYPAILGVLLAAVGVAIAAAALLGSGEPAEDSNESGGPPDWRGWSCIAGGVALFIALAWLAGLAPAIFGCALLAALGDRTATFRGSLVLALAMAIAGTVLFGVLLGINMPVWQWTPEWPFGS